MENRFDTLARRMAGSVSRREALTRLGGGLAGMLLAAVGLDAAWGAPAPNTSCEKLCRSVIDPRQSRGAFGSCVSGCQACLAQGGTPCAAAGAVACVNLSTDPNNCGACGVSCNDNNACTNDACVNGSCVYTSVNCDDNNACTVDTCDSVRGCQHTALNCDDNNACTLDTCDPVRGCVHTPIDCSTAVTCDNGFEPGCDTRLGCRCVPVP